MQKKVYVVGDREAVLGLALVGIDGLATDDPDAAAARLAELRRDPAVGLVLVTAGLARRMEAHLEELRISADLPLIYEIPDHAERPARAPATEVVRRALGVGA